MERFECPPLNKNALQSHDAGPPGQLTVTGAMIMDLTVWSEQGMELWSPWFSGSVFLSEVDHAHSHFHNEHNQNILTDRWRCQKGYTCMNVLAFVNFDRCFTALWDGGDGCASDAWMIQRTCCLDQVRSGFSILFDSGGVNDPKMLLPYPSTRYHLREWDGQRPSNSKELFNLRHSSLRASRVECAFGILKSRFRILKTGIVSSMKTAKLIVRTTAHLHNFITRRTIGEVTPSTNQSELTALCSRVEAINGRGSANHRIIYASDKPLQSCVLTHDRLTSA